MRDAGRGSSVTEDPPPLREGWTTFPSRKRGRARVRAWAPRGRPQSSRSMMICQPWCLQLRGGACLMLPWKGVIQKLLLKEHRLIWNSLAQSWSESERVLSEQIYTVPFLLASPGAEAVTQVSVDSPLQAVCLPLEMVYERFQQPTHGFRDLLGQYLLGEKPKGILETEEMLRVGAGLTGIGELSLHPDGSLHLQPPARGGEFFLCLGDWQTVLSELESASGLWKGAALLCAAAGLAVLLHALCRAYRRSRPRQQQDKELDGEEAGDRAPEDSCVVCLSRPRECVLLGCGHICCCFRCFQALPTRLCPICRGPIDRVVPLYQA
ncbi:mitochondrial ubiquitin ligase activator of nfkb 1-A-like isoform 4-T5 [Cyanocitta cristata]